MILGNGGICLLRCRVELGADDEFWDSDYYRLLERLILSGTSQSAFAPVPADADQHQFIVRKTGSSPSAARTAGTFSPATTASRYESSMSTSAAPSAAQVTRNTCVSPQPHFPLSQPLGTNQFIAITLPSCPKICRWHLGS